MRAILPLALAVASGCARTSSEPGTAAGDTGPAPDVTASTSAPLPRPPLEGGTSLRRRLNLTCRAMAVQGSPTIAVDGGVKPLAASDFADGWVTLAKGERLTVSLPRTGRELAFVGPAVVEPCVGTDEAWVLRGVFEGSRGSGESPGAEQWVVTPFGVVRYGGAILEVAVDDTGVRARLKGGSGTILPEGAAAWEILSPSATRVVKGAPLGKRGTEASADRCAKGSAAARVLEDALVLPDAARSPTFGDLAMRANDAHVLGRAACAVAKLRADPVAAPPAPVP